MIREIWNPRIFKQRGNDKINIQIITTLKRKMRSRVKTPLLLLMTQHQEQIQLAVLIFAHAWLNIRHAVHLSLSLSLLILQVMSLPQKKATSFWEFYEVLELYYWPQNLLINSIYLSRKTPPGLVYMLLEIGITFYTHLSNSLIQFLLPIFSSSLVVFSTALYMRSHTTYY